MEIQSTMRFEDRKRKRTCSPDPPTVNGKMLSLNLDSDEHCSSMFHRLERMRRDKKHCNFVIKLGTEMIGAHRNILAAGSRFFDAMLSQDTKERRSGVVELFRLDEECVRICIGYIYGGEVVIQMEKCEQLMRVACLMQLQEICSGIVDFLEKRLNSKSYFVTKRISVSFGYKKLEEKCELFAEECFTSISKEEEFGNLEKAYIKNILKSRRVKMTEEEKLYVLLKWIRHDEKRSSCLGEMMDCIELDRVSAQYRRELLENDPLIKENLKYFKILSISVMNTMKVVAKRFDDKDTGIVVFDKNSGYLQCFNPGDTTWTRMQRLQEEMIVHDDFTAVSLNERIFVLMSTKSVYQLTYLDEAATWERKADMIVEHGPHPRTTVAACQIYVIGEYLSELKKDITEKYDPATDQWTQLEDNLLPFKFSSILATQVNIYSFGGNVDDQNVNIVQKFDLSFSSSTYMKRMKKAKGSVAAVELDGKIYVLGGCVGKRPAKCVDCYNLDTDDWTSLEPMKNARSCLRAFSVNGFIYVLGRHDEFEDVIEKYNVHGDEWETISVPSKMGLHNLDCVNIVINN